MFSPPSITFSLSYWSPASKGLAGPSAHKPTDPLGTEVMQSRTALLQGSRLSERRTSRRVDLSDIHTLRPHS